MNQNTMHALEFNKIIAKLKQFALTSKAIQKIDQLSPAVDLDIIRVWMKETTEAVAMLERNASVPLISMESVEAVIDKPAKGINLMPEELVFCQNLLETVKKIRKYMASMQSIAPGVASYANSMYELQDLREEIGRCIVNGQVDDRASRELGHIRKRILIVEDRIKQKLNDILRSPAYSAMLQDCLISTRDGRYVVPVQRKYAKKFPGQVLDLSSTGSTVFIEPAVVNKLQQELNLLQMEESNEVYRILSSLTRLVGEFRQELSVDMETLAHYDFIFAKAKYSRSSDMREVSLNNSNHIVIKQGRHPLLGASAVPLDFRLGEDYRALIITGPNTGGKTIALKTVGLLTLMVQCGLHVPVRSGSEFAVFTDILVDIGDGQSIEQSLSTFSAHVKNILTIVRCCDANTLVIMDELGAGTDPAEGRGFAVAVLEEVFQRGASIAATTHFGEIKEYAQKTPGFENGYMAFDVKTLSPLYQLHIGDWGESNAFLIALTLGMEPRIIERAHEITYGEKRCYSERNDPTLTGSDHEFQHHVDTRQAAAEHQQEKQRRQRSRLYVKKDLKVGDRVYISTMQHTGIVFEEENGRGDVGVMVMGKKYVINQKRLTLAIDRKDLYPDDYDMDIIFETKENRKKRKIMNKRHVEGLVIEEDPKSSEP